MPLYENAAVEGTEDIHKPIPASQFSECRSNEKRSERGICEHITVQYKVMTTITSV